MQVIGQAVVEPAIVATFNVGHSVQGADCG